MNQKHKLDLTAAALAESLESPQAPALIDVRTEEEFALCHIKGARNVPLESLAPLLDRPASAPAMVFVCETGLRSRQAANFAIIAAHSDIKSLAGGMAQWRKSFPDRVEQS